MADGNINSVSSPRPSSLNQRSSHSRSQSWSHTSGNGQITLTNLNPIRSVIREFVPSFGHPAPSSHSSSSSPLSPMSPSTYVDLTNILRENTQSDTGRANGRFRNESSGFMNSTSPAVSEFEVEENGPGSEGNTNTSGQSGNGSGRAGDRMEFQGTISWLENSVPFALLLLSRLMWDHRLGILVFIGLCGTFLHANSTIKRQVALKDRRLKRVSLWTIIFLSGNVFFIYYVFYHQHLQNCLIFLRPNFSRMDVWTVFWCVGITDFVIRFITMALKSMIIIQHKKIIPFRKRGKFYLLLEHLSHLYRALVPIPLWFAFFTDYNYGGEYFALVATTLFVLLKIRKVFVKLRDVYGSYKILLHDVQYGVPPSKEDIAEVGNSCPICQEDLTDPVKLKSCKHIFCGDCISLWFDRERTCPMCRAKVAGDPLWRDGGTAAYVQLF